MKQLINEIKLFIRNFHTVLPLSVFQIDYNSICNLSVKPIISINFNIFQLISHIFQFDYINFKYISINNEIINKRN